MTHSIKTLAVVAFTLSTLMTISVVTKDNAQALHRGVKPVVQYTDANVNYDLATADLMVANRF